MSNHLARINLTVEQPIYRSLVRLAKQDNVPLASKVKDLILSALEDIEDIGLIELAENRQKTFSLSKALTHKRFWRKVLKAKK